MNELKPLALRVPHQPDEPPPYYAARLAARNNRPARMFARDLGLELQRLADGHEADVRKLADLSGANYQALMSCAFRKSEGKFELKGQELRKAGLRRVRAQICPKCLQEDIDSSDLPPHLAIHGRANWLLSAIQTCPAHEIALVEVARNIPIHDAHDWTANIAPVVPRLPELANSAACRPTSALEGYLLDRLQGLAKSSWLDEFPFFAAVHVTELIGAVAAFGTRVNFDILNEDQRYEARHAGAKLAHPSPDELLKLMDNLMKEHLSKDTGSTKSPAAIFGKLYTTPAQGLPDPAFDPLRTVMGAFILKRFALGPGDRLFGQPVTERRLHSIRSASLEYKLHPKRLRKILLAEGLISTPKGRDRDVDFAVQHAERIFRREHDSLAMHEVARYLSATRAQTEALLSAGVLKRHKAVGGMKEYVLRPELDHFLSRLLSRAVAVKVKPDRAVGIAEARRCARCTTVEIVRGILDGKLAWVGRLAGFEGLASVLLDIKQVKAATKLGDMPGLTPAVVGREILKTHSIKQLIRSGIIKTVDAVNPLNRHPTKIIEFAEIERFRKEYVSLYLLAQAQGQCMATFKKALRAKGISPVAFDGVEATFYRRADVELMIAPKPSTRGSTAYDTIK